MSFRTQSPHWTLNRPDSLNRALSVKCHSARIARHRSVPGCRNRPIPIQLRAPLTHDDARSQFTGKLAVRSSRVWRSASRHRFAAHCTLDCRIPGRTHLAPVRHADCRTGSCPRSQPPTVRCPLVDRPAPPLDLGRTSQGDVHDHREIRVTSHLARLLEVRTGD